MCVLGEGVAPAEVSTLKGAALHPEQACPSPGPQPARVTALTVPSVWLTGSPKPAVGTLLPAALAEGARWARLAALGPVPAWLAGLTAACIWRAGLILLAVATAGKRRHSCRVLGDVWMECPPRPLGALRASRSQLGHSGRFEPQFLYVVQQKGWTNYLCGLWQSSGSLLPSFQGHQELPAQPELTNDHHKLCLLSAQRAPPLPFPGREWDSVVYLLCYNTKMH